MGCEIFRVVLVYNHSNRKTVQPAKKTKITTHLLIKASEGCWI